MTIWITGANGFIGRHLVRELAEAGTRRMASAMARSKLRKTPSRPVCWINGEIDAANLNALAAAHGPPSRVFHLAGGSSVGLSIAQPFEDFSRTVTSTARLLEWLRGSAPECR